MQSIFTSFALLLATASVANGCKMAGDYYGNIVITPEGQQLVMACDEGDACPGATCNGVDISITTPPVPDGETEGCFVQVFDCGDSGTVEFTAFGCVQTGTAGQVSTYHGLLNASSSQLPRAYPSAVFFSSSQSFM